MELEAWAARCLSRHRSHHCDHDEGDDAEEEEDENEDEHDSSSSASDDEDSDSGDESDDDDDEEADDMPEAGAAPIAEFVRNGEARYQHEHREQQHDEDSLVQRLRVVKL